MRIYEEKEVQTLFHPYDNDKFYLLLVGEDELRVFRYLPKRLKVWKTIEGEEEQDYHGHFHKTRVRTGEYEIHWGVQGIFGNDYGIKLPKSCFSTNVQSVLKVNRLISISPNGEINIELDS